MSTVEPQGTSTAADKHAMSRSVLEPSNQSEKIPPESETRSSSSEHDTTVATALEGELEKTITIATETPPRDSNPIQEVTTAQDWEGPQDPENPLNWPRRWKLYTLAMTGLQCFTITFGSSVITPATSEIAERFGVSIYAAVLTLSIYVLGLACGPILSAPISETFGRRFNYLFLFPPSLLFTLGAGFSNNFGSLLICRFLAATLGSGCLAVGAGTISDIYSSRDRAAASSIWILAPFLGPALGPPVGGFVTMEKSWRWTQWSVLFIGAFTWVFSLPQRETYKRIILQKRAKRHNLAPPPSPLPSAFSARMKVILLVTLLRPLRMLGTESIVAFLSIYTAFNFSVLFAFFAAFPLVFESPYPEIQIYHFNTGEGGLVFLSIGIGCVLCTALFIVIDRLTYRKKLMIKIKSGDNTPLPPEERLYGAMLGSMLLPVGLFWFAWSARADIYWLVPVIACVPFAMGNLMVFCCTVLYLMDTYGARAGASSAAANGMLRYVAGAVFPLFTIQMYRALGVGWATSLLGFVTVLLLPIPWVLWKFGPKIRQRSAYT